VGHHYNQLYQLIKTEVKLCHPEALTSRRQPNISVMQSPFVGVITSSHGMGQNMFSPAKTDQPQKTLSPGSWISFILKEIL
jgi:hypothetical protein